MLFFQAEYFYYDQPMFGDMHEVVKGKFIAFKGPTDERREIGMGHLSKIPKDYLDVFRTKSVTCVVRLNNPQCKKTRPVD